MKAFLSLLSFASTVAANCACGYTVNSTEDANHAVFTDLLETDFLHVQSAAYNSSHNVGWEPQDYPAIAPDSRYVVNRQPRNIVPNYIENRYNWNGPGVKGDDPGLQLWVYKQFIDYDYHYIPSSELVSERDDILYGSFRIAMKTTDQEGTCAAFLFYRNESQEVDFEILSRQQFSGGTSFPIHLIVQNGSALANTADHSEAVQKVYTLTSPSAPTQNYNEYRFDWLPDRISYYINGQHAWTTTENVPTAPGRIHISHWSNGNWLWSGGPPVNDAALTISYVKAYFNSTSTKRHQEYEHICSKASKMSLNQTCEIPAQNSPPNPWGPETGETFFFTQHKDMTPGQAVYTKTWESMSAEQIPFLLSELLVPVLCLCCINMFGYSTLTARQGAGLVFGMWITCFWFYSAPRPLQWFAPVVAFIVAMTIAGSPDYQTIVRARENAERFNAERAQR